MLPRVVPVLLVSAAASAQTLTTTFQRGGVANAVMFDLTPSTPYLRVDQVQINLNIPLSTRFGYRVWTREGSFQGHESDPAGWSLVLEATSVSGGQNFPTYIGGNIQIEEQGRTTGIFIEVTDPIPDPVFFTPIPPALPTYSGPGVRLDGGVAKGPGGFAGATIPSAMVNLSLLPNLCFVNCDASTNVPWLNVGDFTCYLNRFAAGSTYANCDHSTTLPVLNVNDFVCFLGRFVAGCSAP